MAKVILFGGGDAGGILIGPNGVTPIPPFDPPLLMQLRAISLMLRAESSLDDPESRRQLGALLNKFSNLSMSQIEERVGSLDPNDGLIYQDSDGGFYCGSTGRPPIPFPWPAVNVPTIRQLVAGGAVSQDVADFLKAAAEKGADSIALFRDPSAEAKRLGVSISEATARNVIGLNLGDPAKIEDPVDREIVEFFHKAIADGRYVKEWASNPLEVAERLSFPISRTAIDRIVATTNVNLGAREPGSVMSPYGVAVVVVIVIVVWSRERQIPVQDLSGLQKF